MKKSFWAMATLNGNYDVEYEFETNRWYHVACTYEMDDDWYADMKDNINQ